MRCPLCFEKGFSVPFEVWVANYRSSGEIVQVEVFDFEPTAEALSEASVGKYEWEKGIRGHWIARGDPSTWVEVVHRHIVSNQQEGPTSALPTMEEIHLQWQLASRGQETDLWAPGDPQGANPTAKLTGSERVRYAPQLAVLSSYARDLDDWGDDLRSKLRSRFDDTSRETLWQRRPWTPEQLEALEGWYRLPVAMQDRLVSSFS